MPATAQKYDLILKGGTVVDPANQINGTMDVALLDGKIAAVAKDILAPATQVIDMAGYYVTPGLIDMHCHVFPLFPYPTVPTLKTVNVEAFMFQSGFTTAVDAGTCGWRDFQTFKENVIDTSRVRVLAYVNIAAGGMVALPSEQNIKDFHPQMVAALAKTYPDVVVGVKTAHYWTQPQDANHPTWASVDASIQARDMGAGHIMSDFFPVPNERSYADLLLTKLEKGDVHTHVFAKHFPVLTADNKVQDYMFKARERGVLFDLGHGGGSFWFRQAINALKDGFHPDTISTDLHQHNIAGPVFTPLNTMSKCLAMGIPFEEVIFRSTQRPAQVIGHPELGTLSVGACGDVAVLKIRKGDYGYMDCGATRLKAKEQLECIMTIREGRIVYDINAMSLPDWEDAPADYWNNERGVLRNWLLDKTE